MFKKILIANRGEIAVRVIKTCQRLGIGTVAVYSEADADSKAVDMADEAVFIGGSAPGDSYLVMEKIIAAAKETGAEAIHPGFGFLSENPKFPQALEDAGIAWIGPNVTAIEAMGDKITSKKFAIDGNWLSRHDQGVSRRGREGHAYRLFADRSAGWLQIGPR